MSTTSKLLSMQPKLRLAQLFAAVRDLISNRTTTEATSLLYSNDAMPLAASFSFIHTSSSQKGKPFFNNFKSNSMQPKLRLLGMTVAVVLMSFVTTIAFGQATVISDKPDYAPRSNAIFTGSGFLPGETVALKVKNLFRACNTVSADSSYLPWTVTADASGGFVTNWTVCDCNGDSLRLRAVGQSSHDTAYVYFSDAVTSVNIISPKSGSPLTVSAGCRITINYSYTAGSSGANGTATASIRSGSSVIASGILPAPKSVTNSPGSITLFIPANTPSGSYDAQVTVIQGTTITALESGAINISSPSVTQPTASNNSRCGAGTVTIFASAAGGQTIDWYDAASEGNLLASSTSSFTTPNISSTTTYYAEARDINSGCVSARTPVIATVLNGVSSAPVITSPLCAVTTTVSGTSSEPAGSTIKVYRDGIQVGTATVVAGSPNTWTTSIPGSGAGSVITATATATGKCESVASASVIIQESTTPTVTISQTDGTSQTCAGNSVTFTATASNTGGGTVTYTFYADNVEVQAASASNTFTSTSISAGIHSITAKITITGGTCLTASTATSTGVLVTVYTAPSFFVQPSDITTTYGDGAVAFSASVSSPTTLTYQWQINTGSGFVDIPGANYYTLTVSNPTVSMSGYKYHLMATNSCATVTSTEATLTVNPKVLTIGITADNKPYDGTAAAATHAAITGGLVSGDVVTVASSNGLFNNKNVGVGKAVTADVTISGGADAGNYTSNATAATTADITAIALTIGITADNKPYDGTAAAATHAAITGGLVSGDVVTVASSNGLFNNKNVGVGKAVTADVTISGGADAGNYTSNATAATTADITAIALTIGITADNKPYDGTAAAATHAAITGGLVSGDVVTVASSNGLFNNKNVGVGKAVTADVTISGGADAGNYTSNATAATTADITAIALTIGITADNKPYDGTKTASTHASITSGLVSGDLVTVASSNGLFNDKNVEVGKAVTADVSITGGTDAGNYTSNATAATTANITAIALTIGITADNKPYDGTAAATTHASISSGLVSGDLVTVGSANGAFNDKNVGNGKAVTADVSITGGTDAGNYTSNATAATTANITAIALTIGITADNKPYDGTAAATTHASISSGLVSGDVVTVGSANGLFNDKNVEVGKAVTADVTISGGADAGNYTSNATAATTADITAIALTIGITADNKPYDGTAAATTHASISSGLVSGDVVTVGSANGAFNDKNVGNGKAVTADVSITGGTDAGNYTSNATAATTADITAIALTIGITADNKPYDGTAAAATHAAITGGLVSGDVVTVASSNGLFNNKNVGVGKAVTADVSITGGTDAGNYTSNATAATTANITAIALTIGITADNKPYDGTAAAATHAAITGGLVSGDVVTVASSNGLFNNKNVGVGKAVTADVTISGGADAGNYTSNATAATTADITAIALTIGITADNKPYDGTAAAATHAAITGGLVSGDVVTVASSNGLFNNKNVGVGKAVTADVTISGGADAGNYTSNATAATTADITAIALTIGITADNKPYDGTAAAATHAAITGGLVSGDVVTVASSNGLFNNKNVGVGKAVTADVTISGGADAGNYTSNATAATTADITAIALTIGITADNKPYDGTAAAATHAAITGGLVSGDVVTVASSNGLFNNKNVGVGKAVTADVTISGGADAGNYTSNATAATTADITAIALTIGITADNKPYDGTAAAATHAAITGGLVSGDVVTVASSNGLFNNKNVGVGKAVTADVTISGGADAGNYTSNATAATTADITAIALTIGITADNKPYDGTAAAATHAAITGGLVSGDVVTVASSNGLFNNKNVGVGKAVTADVTISGGADAGNYTSNATAATTADITAIALTIGITADNKPYDGTAAAATHAAITGGLVSGDVVTVASSNGLFNNKNVGVGKAVTADVTISGGADAGNYTSNATAATTADITAIALTIGITADNKPYDGTAAAATHAAITGGLVSGDVVTVASSNGLFNNKNVGVGKAVTADVTISGGADAGNYTSNATAATTADITAIALTIGITADNKPYDGTAAAATHAAITGGLVSGDVVTVASSNGLFNNKNVGVGKAVTADVTISGGADAGNYTSNATAATTADITAIALTIGITADNKPYDGTAAAATHAAITGGLVSGDVVTVASSNGLFNNKNVGVGKAVTADVTISGGADAGNYTSNATAATTADITAIALTIGITADNKPYDGTAAAATHAAITGGLVSGDVVTVASSNGLFNNKNVGVGKAVTADVTISGGADAGNYTSNATAATTADITAIALTIGITADNKPYDGTAAAATHAAITGGLVSGDVVTVASSNGLFNNKNVGVGKAVTADVTISGGADAGNYTSNATAATTADITAIALTIGITADNKPYDGTAAAATHAAITGGLVSGDVVTVASSNGLFNNKNVGVGKAVTADVTISGGADAGNYTSNATAATTADITAIALTIGITADNKPYDGTAAAATHAAITGGLVSGDVVTVASSNGLFNNKNVGVGKAVTADVTISGGADAGNYTSNATAATTADITAIALTIGITADNKPYDGTAAAATHAAITGGLVSGDVVTVASSNGLFNNKNVGVGKAVTADVTISGGADAGNYTSNATAATTADITAIALTIGITADNKPYDGTKTASTHASITSGLVSGDLVTVASSNGLFNDKNVEVGKAVTADVSITGGTDAGNYTSNATAATTANITAIALTIGITADNKPYDGTAAATTHASISSGLVSGDLVTVGSANGAFNDKNVGNGKAVTADVSITGGTDAGNYTSNATAATTANITAIALTIGITADNKPYDGTAAATTHASISSGLVSGDVVTVGSANGLFNDKNVEVGKAVTADVTISGGADAGNYTSNATAATTADITAIALTIGITADNKPYDGTAAAATHAAITGGLVSGDVVTVASSNGLFNNKNVGVGKAVTADVTISGGADAGNYTSNATAATTANITAIALTIGITADNKPYDGTAAATTHASISSGLVSGDVVTVGSANGAFNDKNVGNGKAVTADVSITGGTDAGNYTSNATAATTANITAIALTIGITADNKPYDGTAAATTHASISSGLVSGDVVTVASSNGLFNNKNVANGKAVTADVTISGGADAGNYTSNATAATTADITAIALTIGITADNKPYDGTAAAATHAAITGGLVSGDVVTVASSNGLFNNKNVGVGKAVTADVTISGGADAGNYTSNATAATTADITPRDITVSATGINKVFDGTTNATVSLSSNKVTDDAVYLSYTTASFEDPNIGVNKAVSVAGISISGTDAGNYNLVNTTAQTNADITVAASAIFSVTASTSPVQYSDPITLVATITSPTGQTELNNTGGTVQFRLKPATGPVIILGTSGLGDWQVADAKVVVTKQFVITQAPGTYTIEATFTPYSTNINTSINNNLGSLVIAPENARVVYTGDIIKGVTASQSSNVVFDLRATVYDISFPAYAGDNYPGDIQNARVKFVDRDNGNAVIGYGNLIPVLVDGSNTMVGSVSGNVTLTILSAGFITKTIGIVVEGYYSRDDNNDDVMLTAYFATGDFITGGGYIIPDKPSGTYASEPGKKVNFGFNVKFNKNGKALQGNINIIYRKTENGVLTNVQIKNNSMYSLGVNATNKTAEFVSKVSVKNLTTGQPISDANWLYVKMEDNEGKGKPDRISFILVKSQNSPTPADPTILNNIVWSSNWVNLSTNLIDISGGDLVVHSGFNLGNANSIAASANPRVMDNSTATSTQPLIFDSKAYPNPTNSQFNVKLESSNTIDPISIIIYGTNGKVVEQKQKLNAGQTIQLGALYRPGIYILEMIQGNQRKQLKLVKIPD